MSFKTSRQRIVEISGIAALLLLVFVVYARTAAFPAIDYDDGRMVFDHPLIKQGLSWPGLYWALTHGLHGIWMPLTALTHMTDVTLYGSWAGGHHLTNVFWHALAVLMFYAALRALTGARGMSLLAAALFAAHPLRVEAVAWISGRKDLVCGAGFALALLAHARYARRPTLGRYALLFGAVLLALAGKTSAAPIPAVLLLLDTWPLDRFRDSGTGEFSLRRSLWLVAEKIPFGLLAIAVMVVTWRAQHEVGAVVETGGAPPALRVAAMGGHYLHYLAAFLWPFGLSPHYPHPPFILWKSAVAWVAALALSLGALAVRHRRPWVTIGWFWFLVALIPVIGLMQYSNTPYADRYMYLPGMGLSLAAAGLLCEAGARLSRSRIAQMIGVVLSGKCGTGALACQPWSVRGELTAEGDCQGLRLSSRPSEADSVRHAPTAEGGCPAYWTENVLGIALAVLLVLALAGLSWRQTGYWRDTQSAFGRAVQLYPNDDVGYAKLGDCQFAQGNLDGAARFYLEALRIRPDFPDWNYNLGSILVNSDPAGALPFLEKAARLAPNRGDARTNMGCALLQLRQPAAALPHLEEGARLDSGNPNAHLNLGVAYMNLGRKDEARAAFQRALALDPANAVAQANLKLLKQ